MTYKEFKYLLFSDLYRYAGKFDFLTFLRNFLFNPGFKYSFWMRLCRYLNDKKIFKILLLFYIARLILNHYKYKYGIDIPYLTQIGSGFYIGHFGGIVFNEKSVIGKNCNISTGVVLGKANRGKSMGYPQIENNVYIGPGVKIVGGIKIGSNAALGANCVVVDDIPDNAVVVGIPGKVVSFNGSQGYVNKIDYE